MLFLMVDSVAVEAGAAEEPVSVALDVVLVSRCSWRKMRLMERTWATSTAPSAGIVSRCVNGRSLRSAG